MGRPRPRLKSHDRKSTRRVPVGGLWVTTPAQGIFVSDFVPKNKSPTTTRTRVLSLLQTRRKATTTRDLPKVVLE